MKQNPSILFHTMHNSLINRYLRAIAVPACVITAAVAAESPFDPAKSFTPTQSDLVDVYLQVAQSLEYYGSPIPYLHHINNEHTRVEQIYKENKGRTGSFRPMTEAQLEQFTKNWDYLSPKLGLESLSKNIAKQMLLALCGNNGSGTAVSDILKRHGRDLYESMANRGQTNFVSLQSKLIELVNRNGSSSDPKAVEAIEAGKAIDKLLKNLFAKLDAALPQQDAAAIKDALLGAFSTVGEMADSEVKLALLEAALDFSNAGAAYSADSEKELTPPERKTYAAFLAKKRFSKADFSALDAFYKTGYDKLSERGKKEMSSRIWSGVQEKN